MLGKINGEKVISVNIFGMNQGYSVIDGLKSYEEAYKTIKDIKASDRRVLGYTDDYVLELETETNVYRFFALKKYKGKYVVKQIRRL